MGRRFIIQADQKSLQALLDQAIQTPEQQHYLAKLLGYQYTIVYKLGRENRVADALSGKPEETRLQFLAFTQVQFKLLDALRLENSTTPFVINLYKSMEMQLDQF